MKAFLISVLLASASVTAIMLEPATAAASQPKTANKASTTQAAIHEAVRLMGNAQWSEAIELLTQVIAREPHNALAYANRALCYTWTNRLDEAEHDLDAAEANGPDAAINHRVRAMLADGHGDKNTALREISLSLQGEPNNAFARRFRANLLMDMRHDSAALVDAEAWIRADPSQPDGYVFKARLLAIQMKATLAIDVARQLDAQFPNSPTMAAAASDIYFLVGDRTRALDEIDRAIASNPQDSWYYLQRAKLRRWDDTSDRRSDLKTAASLAPDDLYPVVELALLDFQERNWSDAINGFSRILDLEPNDFVVLAYRAMAREKAGDATGAARDYDAALAASPSADDLERICDALGQEGVALDRALAACDRAAAMAPADGRNRGTRALVNLRLGRLDAALADYAVGVDADDRSAPFFYGRALTRHRLGDQTGATADLSRARQIDPLIDETFAKAGLNDLATTPTAQAAGPEATPASP